MKGWEKEICNWVGWWGWGRCGRRGFLLKNRLGILKISFLPLANQGRHRPQTVSASKSFITEAVTLNAGRMLQLVASNYPLSTQPHTGSKGQGPQGGHHFSILWCSWPHGAGVHLTTAFAGQQPPSPRLRHPACCWDWFPVGSCSQLQRTFGVTSLSVLLGLGEEWSTELISSLVNTPSQLHHLSLAGCFNSSPSLSGCPCRACSHTQTHTYTHTHSPRSFYNKLAFIFDRRRKGGRRLVI